MGYFIVLSKMCDIFLYKCLLWFRSCNSDMMKKCNVCVFSSMRKEIFLNKCTTDDKECMSVC